MIQETPRPYDSRLFGRFDDHLRAIVMTPTFPVWVPLAIGIQSIWEGRDYLKKELTAFGRVMARAPIEEIYKALLDEDDSKLFQYSRRKMR
jgi:hypothetical protein